MTIPLYKVHMPENIAQVLEPVLLSGFITEGPKAKAFEEAFQRYIGNSYTAVVNSGTSALTLALKLAGAGPGTEIISSPMTCFSYLTPVLLEDGSTLPIGKIVSQKITCSVVSFNQEEQRLESKAVTNWIKQSGVGVDWYRLHTKNARVARGPGGKAGVFVTGDHQVLTERGYVRVDSLMSADKIITNQRNLNSRQKEFVVGTLLGDASISCGGKGWGRFSVAHIFDQRVWINLKERALNGFSLNREEYPEKPGHQAIIRLETKKSVEWRNLYSEWYSKGKKVVPNSIDLTPLALAAWYMDDGSLTASNGALFCTEGFDNPSFWILFYKLVALGFRPHAVRRGPGYIITLGDGVDGEGSATRFFNIIAPYIPEALRYKLPPGLPEYDSSLWDLGESVVATDYPVVTKVDSPPDWHKPSSVYCLEVKDNHNFVTAGMVVSNCLATNVPVVTLGSDLVWCDVDPCTGNIDADKIEALITPKTKAILFVDWAGTPAELDKINAVAAKYGIKTIEDAAHALGSTYRGKNTGTACDYSCFLGSTKVWTEKGYKRIDEIKVGDRVFGENGLYNKVVDTMSRGYVGEWVNIRVGQRKLLMTAEHPIKINREGKDLSLRAEEVREGDCAYVVTKACEQCDKNLIPFYNKVCVTCYTENNISEKKKIKNQKLKGKSFRKTSRLLHHSVYVVPEMKKFEQKGYRVIPIAKVIPDFLAIKDGKIVAVEVESTTTVRLGKVDKYEHLEDRHSYDDVVWITQPVSVKKKRYQYETIGSFARVRVSSVRKFPVDKKRQVYNLSVEKSQTYCAKGILVHNCFSFQAIKHLTTVDGGALACKTQEDYDRVVLLRWFGLRRGCNASPVCWGVDVPEAGFKMHMNDVNATIGLEQLNYLDNIVEAHRSNGNFLIAALKNVPNVETCAVSSYIESSFWFFTIMLENSEHREAVSRGLERCGVASGISHDRNDKYSVFDKYRTTLPNLDIFSERMLNIPCGWWVGQEDLEHIVNSIKKVC